MRTYYEHSEAPLAYRPSANRSRRAPAFTLIEVVISMTVSVIICGLAGSLIWNASKQRTEAGARCELIDSGSAALELMLRYLREIPQNECPASASPCLNGNAQVTTASATDLRFDIYGFRLNSTNLEMTKNSGTSWFTLLTDMTGLTFSYYDRSNVALTSLPLSSTDRAKIRRVRVQIDMSRASQTARLRSSVYLRNFMNEVASDP